MTALSSVSRPPETNEDEAIWGAQFMTGLWPNRAKAPMSTFCKGDKWLDRLVSPAPCPPRASPLVGFFRRRRSRRNPGLHACLGCSAALSPSLNGHGAGLLPREVPLQLFSRPSRPPRLRSCVSKQSTVAAMQPQRPAAAPTRSNGTWRVQGSRRLGLIIAETRTAIITIIDRGRSSSVSRLPAQLHRQPVDGSRHDIGTRCFRQALSESAPS